MQYSKTISKALIEFQSLRRILIIFLTWMSRRIDLTGFNLGLCSRVHVWRKGCLDIWHKSLSRGFTEGQTPSNMSKVLILTQDWPWEFVLIFAMNRKASFTLQNSLGYFLGRFWLRLSYLKREKSKHPFSFP